MCFLFTGLCLQMTVQLSFNDFAITIRAIYFYLISCSVILFQPISIVLSILFILFLKIVFIGFIMLFRFFRFLWMFFGICLIINFTSCPTSYTCFISLFYSCISKVFIDMFFIIYIFRSTLTTNNVFIVLAFFCHFQLYILTPPNL